MMATTMTDEFDVWIERARSGALDDTRIAGLAERLAASGERLDTGGHTADIASTGGPGSLSTLWAPPALVASGFRVPKLGVPGRPAGGVDVLAQLPGYTIDLDSHAAHEVLERCGYVHVLAGAKFAPADATMFAHRQRVGAQSIPALAVASLLAKKLAMGVRRVGLEVRVAPHGNFGADPDKAAANAWAFCRVAKLVGIEATCFLTDGTVPQQPYIGRGEAILALSLLLGGTAETWLQSHAGTCEDWASTLAGSDQPKHSRISFAFTSNVVAQGGSLEALEESAARVAASHSYLVFAEREGVLSFDLGGLREAILAARGADEGLRFDDSAGLILLVEPGTVVRAGEPLVSARCSDCARPSLRNAVSAAIRLAEPNDAATRRPLFGTLEVIGVGGR
jgi:thymidine phosphorylase